MAGVLVAVVVFRKMRMMIDRNGRNVLLEHGSCVDTLAWRLPLQRRHGRLLQSDNSTADIGCSAADR